MQSNGHKNISRLRCPSRTHHRSNKQTNKIESTINMKRRTTENIVNNNRQNSFQIATKMWKKKFKSNSIQSITRKNIHNFHCLVIAEYKSRRFDGMHNAHHVHHSQHDELLCAIVRMYVRISAAAVSQKRPAANKIKTISHYPSIHLSIYLSLFIVYSSYILMAW